MSEPSRMQYLTAEVTQWLKDDATVRDEAARIAAQPGKSTVSNLGSWLWHTIHAAPRSSKAWHLAQELAPNDYFRVSWGAVTRSIQDT
ncbi:hypothetical protein [Amycolatopsis sp. NPDC004079]|uniref:hypothetical protein n=1 Tax=Amycolatopsis sp. NPDC004079 TaxID=3154549 RepID=UPI0033A7B1CF